MVARVLIVLAAAAVAMASAGSVNITATGPPQDIWMAVDTLHKCGHLDVPDTPARAFFHPQTNLTHIITSSTTFYTLNGPSLFNATRNCTLSYNSTEDPVPSMFASNEWIDSTYSFGNGTVIVLMHTEYPGNVYHNCTGPAYPRCWTVTVGLGISHDWGFTWNHARPPPHHLVFAVPYPYNQSQLAYGWGDPSNILRSPKDDYFYVAVWNRDQVGLQAPGICVARTQQLADPTSWRGWSGTEFNVTFVSPYTLPPGTEAEHICTPVNLPSNCAPGSMVWSTYVQEFVMTLGCGGKFSFSTSPDLIHWSPAQDLYSPPPMPMVVNKNYPAFIDPTAPTALGDPNYYTIGQMPYLTWVSMGHSPYSDGRHLWGTPMKFSKDS